MRYVKVLVLIQGLLCFGELVYETVAYPQSQGESLPGTSWENTDHGISGLRACSSLHFRTRYIMVLLYIV